MPSTGLAEEVCGTGKLPDGSSSAAAPLGAKRRSGTAGSVASRPIPLSLVLPARSSGVRTCPPVCAAVAGSGCPGWTVAMSHYTEGRCHAAPIPWESLAVSSLRDPGTTVGGPQREATWRACGLRPQDAGLPAGALSTSAVRATALSAGAGRRASIPPAHRTPTPPPPA